MRFAPAPSFAKGSGKQIQAVCQVCIVKSFSMHPEFPLQQGCYRSQRIWRRYGRLERLRGAGRLVTCQPACQPALLVMTTGLLPDHLPQLKCNCKKVCISFTSSIFMVYSACSRKAYQRQSFTLAQLNESHRKKPALIT